MTSTVLSGTRGAVRRSRSFESSRRARGGDCASSNGGSSNGGSCPTGAAADLREAAEWAQAALHDAALAAEPRLIRSAQGEWSRVSGVDESPRARPASPPSSIQEASMHAVVQARPVDATAPRAAHLRVGTLAHASTCHLSRRRNGPT